MSPRSAPLLLGLRHWLIKSQWKRWVIPLLCSLPYLLALVWLLVRQLFWIAQVMLAPLAMAGLIVGLTWWLARLEFRTR